MSPSPPAPVQRPTTRRTPARSRPRAQAGAAALGFVLVAVPLLMLGLGGVEVAHWATMRQTVDLALLQAARAGSTHQGDPAAMARAFEEALRMVAPGGVQRQASLARRRDAIGWPWRIRVLQPTAAALIEHADASLAGAGRGARPTVRNDGQAAQHARNQQRGWVGGRGPQSGQTVFEANTLILALWWPHAPRLPGFAGVLRALAAHTQDADSRAILRAGHLPLRRTLSLAMQSQPTPWPDLPDGRVVHGAGGAVPAESVDDGRRSAPPGGTEGHAGHGEEGSSGGEPAKEAPGDPGLPTSDPTDPSGAGSGSATQPDERGTGPDLADDGSAPPDYGGPPADDTLPYCDGSLPAP